MTPPALAHRWDTSLSLRYLASRKKEREKAHALGDKKYNEWHKKDQEFLDAIKKKKVKQKEAERLKLEQLKVRLQILQNLFRTTPDLTTYDTVGKTCATLQQPFFHRAITIS
jgi:vacuolar-type H+-ATPase subunit B/Vma2